MSHNVSFVFEFNRNRLFWKVSESLLLMESKLPRMVSVDIPEHLRNVMFNRHVQTGHHENDCFEVVLTCGPKLYATKKKQILAICDLTKSIAKGT